VLVITMVLMLVLLTELTSNTATTAAFLPLVGALAVSLGDPPLLLIIPATLAASCAFMLPVATPPNAIVFSSGYLEQRDMTRSGFLLNLIGVILVTVAAYSLVLWVFQLQV
jgi:sodium-dependent dicarboxylate transporter 2/3/5